MMSLNFDVAQQRNDMIKVEVNLPSQPAAKPSGGGAHVVLRPFGTKILSHDDGN